MIEKLFKDMAEKGLIVKSRKSAIIFEADSGTVFDGFSHGYDVGYDFSPEVYKSFVLYLFEQAKLSWPGIYPKECDSLGSDYYEYHDSKLDNNGYLTLFSSVPSISLSRPDVLSLKLYQFNKRKMQSFLFDLNKCAASLALDQS